MQWSPLLRGRRSRTEQATCCRLGFVSRLFVIGFALGNDRLLWNSRLRSTRFVFLGLDGIKTLLKPSLLRPSPVLIRTECRVGLFHNNRWLGNKASDMPGPTANVFTSGSTNTATNFNKNISGVRSFEHSTYDILRQISNPLGVIAVGR